MIATHILAKTSLIISDLIYRRKKLSHCATGTRFHGKHRPATTIMRTFQCVTSMHINWLFAPNALSWFKKGNMGKERKK